MMYGWRATGAIWLMAAMTAGGMVRRVIAQGVLDSTGSNLPNSPLLPGDAERNRKLHIGLDQTTPHAFEPIYLVLTAEHFVPDTMPEVMVAKDNENWQPVAIADKAWTRSEAPSPGITPLRRLGVVLQLKASTGLARDYLFPTAGEYRLQVKMGPDSTTLTLHVQDPQLGEQEAWDALGTLVSNIISNDIDDQPGQAVVDACGSITRRFPRSICARYCRAYLDISRFKLMFDQSGKTGGVSAYGQVAADLAKDNDNFHDTFFGELTGFYASYAVGLTHKFDDLMKTAEAVTTHYTPYSDALQGMRMEVLTHRMPKVIPVDPGPLPSATQPAARP
jgi:hypothetical protein